MQEFMFETFTDVVNQGCFFCGNDSINVSSTNHEYDHCIDVCRKQFITRETWSLAFEVKDDLGCSKVILTALEDLVKQNWL